MLHSRGTHKTMNNKDHPSSGFHKDRAKSGEQQRSKQRSKLKYLKYSPPSSAGAEPGQWRQMIGKGSAEKRRLMRSNNEMNSLAVDVANVSLNFNNSPVGNISVNGNTYDGRPANRSGNEEQRSGASRGRLTAPSGVAADPLVFNGKWTRRSTSNRLLNCFTIDDCMTRYRTRLALGQGGPEAWATAKSDLAYSIDGLPTPINCIESLTELTDEHKTLSASREGNVVSSQRGVTAQTRETFDETLLGDDTIDVCVSDNIALTKAMHTIISSNEVLNNHAYTGLFHRTRKPHRGGNQPRPESRRFRKMNDTLHKWIDKEVIMPHSRMGSINCLRSRSFGAQTADETQKQNSLGPHSANYRGPRSMDAPAVSLSRQNAIDVHDTLGEKLTPDIGHSQDALNSKGPYRSDSFLEMLMDMDDGKQQDQTGSTESNSQLPSETNTFVKDKQKGIQTDA